MSSVEDGMVRADPPVFDAFFPTSYEPALGGKRNTKLRFMAPPVD
jgi:hypothetical protein